MPDSILFIKQRLWVCYLFYFIFEVGSHIVQASQERLYLPNASIIRSMCGPPSLTPFYLFLKVLCVFLFFGMYFRLAWIFHTSTFKFQMLGIEGQGVTHLTPHAWSNSLFQSLKLFGY